MFAQPILVLVPASGQYLHRPRLLSKRPVELVVEEQTEGLLSGRLDLGFIRERLNIDGLLTETVLEDKLVVAFRPTMLSPARASWRWVH